MLNNSDCFMESEMERTIISKVNQERKRRIFRKKEQRDLKKRRSATITITITNYIIVVLQQCIYDNLQLIRIKIIIASQVCHISAFLRIIWHPFVYHGFGQT